MEQQKSDTMRVLFIGAHPDDPDIIGGGTAIRFVEAGADVRFLSLTNGDKGHHRLSPIMLATRRLHEAQQSAAVLGIREYRILTTHDCELEATLDNRKAVTRIIRQFAPHLIFTHRTCDYHPDHRATGTLVMDSAYLLGVPHWCPDTPIPPTHPAIYLMRDSFTYPRPLRPDVIVPVDKEMPRLADAILCHASQFLEWLPFDMGIADEVPPQDDMEARRAFIVRHWMKPRKAADADKLRPLLTERFGESQGRAIQYVEYYELSEYGYQPTAEEQQALFPFL
jgi:LmbE family N-acetylglucosaminyl deacetylase